MITHFIHIIQINGINHGKTQQVITLLTLTRNGQIYKHVKHVARLMLLNFRSLSIKELYIDAQFCYLAVVCWLQIVVMDMIFFTWPSIGHYIGKTASTQPFTAEESVMGFWERRPYRLELWYSSILLKRAGHYSVASRLLIAHTEFRALYDRSDPVGSLSATWCSAFSDCILLPLQWPCCGPDTWAYSATLP